MYWVEVLQNKGNPDFKLALGKKRDVVRNDDPGLTIARVRFSPS